MILRVVTALILLMFAAGIAVEACGPAASAPSEPGAEQPSGGPTLPFPADSDEGPAGTIEVPPPID